MKLGAWTGMGSILPLVALQPTMHDSTDLAHTKPIEISSAATDYSDVLDRLPDEIQQAQPFTFTTPIFAPPNQFWKTISVDSCYGDSSVTLTDSVRLKDNLIMVILESYNRNDDFSTEEIQKLHELVREPNPCIRGISLWLLAGSPNAVDTWTLQQAYQIERDERVKSHFETLLK